MEVFIFLKMISLNKALYKDMGNSCSNCEGEMFHFFLTNNKYM